MRRERANARGHLRSDPVAYKPATYVELPNYADLGDRIRPQCGHCKHWVGDWLEAERVHLQGWQRAALFRLPDGRVVQRWIPSAHRAARKSPKVTIREDGRSMSIPFASIRPPAQSRVGWAPLPVLVQCRRQECKGWSLVERLPRKGLAAE